VKRKHGDWRKTLGRKCKSQTTIIKGVEADGAWIMATWTAQLKGMCKARGVDGNVTFSGKIKIGPSGAGISMVKEYYQL